MELDEVGWEVVLELVVLELEEVVLELKLVLELDE